MICLYMKLQTHQVVSESVACSCYWEGFFFDLRIAVGVMDLEAYRYLRDCPFTCRDMQLAPLRVFVAGFRNTLWKTLMGMTVTSAPVSILNSSDIPFTDSVMDQGLDPLDCCTTPIKASSSLMDSTVLTAP